jgi:D-serine deaminase-like pyridoxal phosphate-dependent protein
MPLADVDTPALLIDLDAFEGNLQRLAGAVQTHGVRLRPHAKTHKCAMIALKQIELGAVGICCQKVSEAEALIYAGVRDILVSNQVVGETKLQRLAALAHQARMGVCVDDAGNIDDLNRVMAAHDVTIEVLVEIDVGAFRCGVAPGEPALALAQRIAAASHLRFGGLQAYQGKAQHIREYEQRREAIEQAVAATRQTVELLDSHGLDCRTVAGAGTGSYRFEAGSGVYNELQAGSYIFMDADYGRNRKQDGAFFDEFENSLFVYTTVMSKTRPEQIVVDAGLKALSVDSGMPQVAGMPSVSYLRASDEHGVLALDEDHDSLNVGAKIKLIPGHCDPTVNLYDWYVGIRNDRVEALWPVTARGAVL